MATSGEEAEAAAAASGAGGKVCKIPFRRGHRPTTPYDRPPASMRGMNSHNNARNNSDSLFAKLVVDPASKLIIYGSHRFFASVFRKPLPPTPPQPTEVNGDLIDEPHLVVANDQIGAQKSERGDLTNLSNSSSSCGILELEQLLKQKTFSRSEVNHLVELLQSRAVESSFRVESQRTEKVVSDSGRHPITSGPLEENINDWGKSQGIMSSSMNTRVIEDGPASPTELAKAYMSSRPSKILSSMLGTRSLSENGFVTPKSQGRLAIYSMARTPYSRIYPHSIQKALKRKNSELGGDLGSVVPIRRIRQKPNLLASKTSVTASGLESSSDSVLLSSKQKLPLIVEPKNSVSKTVGENQDDNISSASYTHVPSRSSEVVARIFQHLEKLNPKEKSPECKLVKLRDKSSLRLTSRMLGGDAVKIKEDVVSPLLLLNFQDGRRMVDRSPAILPDVRYSTFQKLGNAGQRSTEDSVVRAELLNPSIKNDIVESLNVPGPSSETVHNFVKNGLAQPSVEVRAFRMSAQEDDGVNCYEIAPGPLAEREGPDGTPFVDNNASVTKEPMLLKANNQPKPIIPSGHILNETTESGTAGPMIGLGNGGTIFPPFSAAIQSELNPHSVDFSKLKGTKDFPPSSNFSSSTVDKIPSLPSEASNGMTVFRSENSNSLVNVLPSATGSDQIGLHLLKAEAANGNYHTVPSTALNGLLVLSSPAASLTAISSCDTNQVSTASSSLFNISTSIASFGSNGNGTNTSATISGNLSGSIVPSVLGGPVATFGGAFVNSTTTVSATLPAYDSELVDLETKAGKEPNSGWSSGKHSAAANSGSSGMGLDTSASYSSVHDLKLSPFAGANKFLVSSVETVSKSTSTQSVSSVLLPSSNINSSISFGTSLSNSHFMQQQTFSSNSSASPSDSVAVSFSSSPAKSVNRFSGSSVMTSVPNNTSSFSTGATGFSFSASSAAFTPKSSSSPVFNSSTNPLSSPIFSFAATSPVMYSPPPNIAQSMFGNEPPISAVSLGNDDQMNTDDNMAEDTVQYSTPSIPVYGQPAVSPTPPGFMFASPAAPFSIGGQQNQVTPQNPLFQRSGGSFSLGSGGGDKSTRKFIKANRNKNRKK